MRNVKTMVGVTMAGCAALAACVGTATAPELAVVPPESRVDAAQLATCSDVSILLDHKVNFIPPLYDYLDAVRQSGCGYTTFRVDMSGAGYNAGYSQSEAVDAVRSYRASHGLDWRAERYLIDPRIPDHHIKVTFLAPPGAAPKPQPQPLAGDPV